ncbi:MAG: Type fimbrial biosis protein PilY1 [Labilithrix sp.]|nr:Type fimbrial biosis protein PilY1 [Labilithrix sp.]
MSGRTSRVLATLLVAVATGALAAACSSFDDADPPPAEGGTETGAVDTGAADTIVSDAPVDSGLDTALPALTTGCSDGTREAFLRTEKIAACEGAWTVAGIFPSHAPVCKRSAGNSSANVDGTGCGPVDLCAAGWHVCTGGLDVALHGGAGDVCGLGNTQTGQLFFATAQAGDGDGVCASMYEDSRINDVYGCGDVPTPPLTACMPLNARIDHTFHPADFQPLSDNGERELVTKTAGPGGVLCCSD